MQCFECGAPAQHDHHVIPQSLGGTCTVPLCERCHGLVHDRGMVSHTTLTRSGQARARAEGRLISGQPAYGLRRVSRESQFLEQDPDEQETMRQAQALHAAKLSLRAIAATLAEHGRLSRGGRPFTPNRIAAMLERARPQNMRPID